MFTSFYNLNAYNSVFMKKWRDIQSLCLASYDFGLITMFSFSLFPLQAPESYKNVTDVVNTCHAAGISKKAIKLRPIAVIKG